MMRIDIAGKSFGDTPVLGAIRFDVGAEEKLAVTGPSGIGKSTLLRIAAGLDGDFEGQVSGAGRLSFVFQEPTLLPWRTALDNIVLAADASANEAEALLASVGLGDRTAHYPGQLSLGQQRRVAIARAFARKPDTLLMDEPFASLDAETAEAMRRLLAGLLTERPTRLILVTHDAGEASELADRIICLAGNPAVVVG